MPQPVEERGRERLRRYASFVRALVSFHPKLFSIAVGGAMLFAVATVASSIAVQWVIDHVIVPRFDPSEGEQLVTSTIVFGCLAIIVIGVFRVDRRDPAPIVRRLSPSGGSPNRSAGQVIDQLVDQPPSWHQRQSDGQLLARAGVDVDTSVSVMAPIPFATGTVRDGRRRRRVAASTPMW